MQIYLLRIYISSLFFLLILFNGKAYGQEATPEESKYKIVVTELEGEVGPSTVNIVNGAIKKAENIGASLIIFKLNTYGGILDNADEARQKILDTKIDTWAFVDKNAASAGALLSIACDSIFMTGGASIGAATVVDSYGQPATDKYQSYMRSIMRSTASENGRNPRIAEAMVDERIEIDSIKPAGRILSFTTDEAIEHGFCEGKFRSIEEILTHYEATNYELIEFAYKPKIGDGVTSFLKADWVSVFLIIVVFLGLYVELSTPGFGIPLLVSFGALGLFGAIHYMEGFVENWEILALIVGVGLLFAEFFVIPGFGIAGILGIVFVVGSLGLMMVDNDGFDMSKVADKRLYAVLGYTSFSLFVSVVGFFLIVPRLMKTKAFKKISVETTMDSKDGYVSHDIDLKPYVGLEGVASTILRPLGKILLDGKIYDAKTQFGYLEENTPIKVLGFDGAVLIVGKAPQTIATTEMTEDA